MLDHFDTFLAFALVMLLLSLVVTTLVQIVVVAFGLRASNLMWGVRQLLELSPTLQTNAKAIAEKALSHPSVAPFRKATAIGSRELLAVLRELSKGSDTFAGQLQQASQKLPPTLQETKDTALKAIADLEKQYPGQALKIKESVTALSHQAVTQISELEDTVNKWFDIVMARATERFKVWCQFWSIGIALSIALCLHIDSLQLLQRLSDDPELRANMIRTIDNNVAQAEAALGRNPVAHDALMSLETDLPEELQGKIPTHFTRRDQALAWVQENTENPAELQEKYGTEFDRLTRERLGEHAVEISRIRSDLVRADLIVIPEDFPNLGSYWGQWKHLLGTLVTGAFMALGAPFWFNLLRTASSLRPILAGKLDPSKDGQA